MNIKTILLVFKKELLDTIRDRRTLFVMTILPILMNLFLVIVMSQITAMQVKKIRSQKMKVVLKEPQIPGELRQAILAHEKLTIMDTEWNSFDILSEAPTTKFILGYQNTQLKTLEFKEVQGDFQDYIQKNEYGKQEEHDGAVLIVRKTKEGLLTFDDEGGMYYWKEGQLLQKTSLGGKVQDFSFTPNSSDFVICGYNQKVQKFTWKAGLPVQTHEFYYETARLCSLAIHQETLFVGTDKGEVLTLVPQGDQLKLLRQMKVEPSSEEDMANSVGPNKRYKKIFPILDLAVHQQQLILIYKNQVIGFSGNHWDEKQFSYTFPNNVCKLLPIHDQLFVALTSGKIFWISLPPEQPIQFSVADLKNIVVDFHQQGERLYVLTWGGKLHSLLITPRSLLPITEPIFPSYPRMTFPDQLQWLRENEIQLILELPKNFEKELFEARETTRLLIHYYGANDQHQTAFSYFEEVVEAYSQNILTDRLLYRMNQDPNFANPLKLYTQNQANSEERGAFHIGKIIAMLIIMMTITSPFYTAIDLGAGEKERGTMETLLVSPLNRKEIVVGKYLTIVTISLVAALFNLGSVALSFTYFAKTFNSLSSAQANEKYLPDEEQMDLNWQRDNRRMEFQITWKQIGVILCILLPLIGFFSAMSLALSIFAKSYKEGQNYLSPLIAISMVPAMAGMIPNFELSPSLCFIPVLNAVLLFKELFLGNFILSHILISLGSTIVYCVIAIYWTVGLFDKEEVLFRQTDDVNIKFWVPVGPPRKTPMRLQAVFLFVLVMILAFYVGAKLQDPTKSFSGKPLTTTDEIVKKLMLGLFLTQVLLIAAPSLWLIRSAKMNFRETLSLKPFKFSAIPISLLFIMACFFINLWIGGMTQKVMPESGMDMKRLEKVL
ncbi:MAG: ABC transporter permease, partial [Planctomycetota bacterium]